MSVLDNNLDIRIFIEYRGEKLQLNRIFSEIDLVDIMPHEEMLFRPEDIQRLMERKERRERMVTMLSSSLAHAITEGLYKKAQRK